MQTVDGNHTMTITFHKTGVWTNAFLGDSYSIEYVFKTLNELPIATFTYSNFNASIKFNDAIFKIEPVPGVLTIKKYVIHEDDSIIGQVKGLSIELSNRRVFKLKRRYKSVLERLFNSTNYWIELKGDGRLVSYEFEKGASFDKGYSNGRYHELTGKIEVGIDDLVLSLFGVFLIERLLDEEGS